MIDPVTEDLLIEGAPGLFQPVHGFRFNIDSLLLAAFAATMPVSGLVLDLGAGVGSVGLSLGHCHHSLRVVLIECQPTLAELARRNLVASGCEGEVLELTLDQSDLPEALQQQANLVVANPPFFEPKAGRPSHHSSERQARFGALRPFVNAAAQALAGPKARAMFVYPARSLQTFLSTAEAHGLFAKRLRLIHPRHDAEARVALVELRRANPGGLKIESPLFEWAAPGQRCPELLAFTNSVQKRLQR